MKKIAVKSGLKQLHLFANENYQYYEAYLDGTECLQQLLNTKMQLISLHMPAKIKVRDHLLPVNFCDKTEVGEESFKKLEEYIHFADKNDVPFIVVHLGFFNSLLDDRTIVLERTAAKFNQLNPKKVKLCLENVPCWTTLSFENEPLISDEQHFAMFKQNCPRIGLVLDIDHLAINTVFNYFYPEFKQKYSSGKNSNSVQMEQEINQKVNKNKPLFKQLVEKKITEFLSAISPDLVHAVGSDFCNYVLNQKLPLIGEALPLNFEGKIGNRQVSDRIDHSIWLSKISEDTPIIIELMLRDDYDYLEMIRNDFKYLSKGIK